MIVSDLESLCFELIAGGVIDAVRRGAMTPEIDAHLEAFLAWCNQPGYTEAGLAEALEEGRLREVTGNEKLAIFDAMLAKTFGGTR